MSFKYTPQNIDVRKRPHSKIQDVDFDHLVFGKTFMDHMFVVDFEDDILPGCIITHGGEVVNETIKNIMEGGA